MTAKLPMLQTLSWRFACPVLLSILGNRFRGSQGKSFIWGCFSGVREKKRQRQEGERSYKSTRLRRTQREAGKRQRDKEREIGRWRDIESKRHGGADTTERNRASLVLSAKDSTCQCRRLGFDPWSRKLPCATVQLSHNYWACALELGSGNYWAQEPRAHGLNTRSQLGEKPRHRE